MGCYSMIPGSLKVRSLAMARFPSSSSRHAMKSCAGAPGTASRAPVHGQSALVGLFLQFPNPLPPRRCRNIAVWLEAVNQGDFRSERSEAAPASAWRLIPVDTCSGRGPLDDGEVRNIELRPGLF